MGGVAADPQAIEQQRMLMDMQQQEQEGLAQTQLGNQYMVM